MKIGELSQRTGLAPSTIRFYEAKGLLPAAQRQPNGYRDYPESSLAMLSIIANAQATGFSLEEIKSLLPASGLSSWDHSRLMQALHEKLQELEAMHLKLKKSKRDLQALIALIEAKPAAMDCGDNARRVMDVLGMGVRRGSA